MNDEIEIIENVPKIEKKNNKKILIIGLISIIALVIIIVIISLLLSKPSNAKVTTIEDNKDEEVLKDAFMSNFKNEAQIYASYLKTAYVEKSNNVINVMDDSVKATTDIYNVTIDNKYYYYLCMTLNDLVNEGYLPKTLKENEGGYVQIWISEKDNEEKTFINVTNGKYYYQADNASEQPIDGIEVPTSTTTCPTTAKFQQ